MAQEKAIWQNPKAGDDAVFVAVFKFLLEKGHDPAEKEAALAALLKRDPKKIAVLFTQMNLGTQSQGTFDDFSVGGRHPSERVSKVLTSLLRQSLLTMPAAVRTGYMDWLVQIAAYAMQRADHQTVLQILNSFPFNALDIKMAQLNQEIGKPVNPFEKSVLAMKDLQTFINLGAFYNQGDQAAFLLYQLRSLQYNAGDDLRVTYRVQEMLPVDKRREPILQGDEQLKGLPVDTFMNYFVPGKREMVHELPLTPASLKSYFQFSNDKMKTRLEITETFRVLQVMQDTAQTVDFIADIDMAIDAAQRKIGILTAHRDSFPGHSDVKAITTQIESETEHLKRLHYLKLSYLWEKGTGAELDQARFNAFLDVSRKVIKETDFRHQLMEKIASKPSDEAFDDFCNRLEDELGEQESEAQQTIDQARAKEVVAQLDQPELDSELKKALLTELKTLHQKFYTQALRQFLDSVRNADRDPNDLPDQHFEKAIQLGLQFAFDAFDHIPLTEKMIQDRAVTQSRSRVFFTDMMLIADQKRRNDQKPIDSTAAKQLAMLTEDVDLDELKEPLEQVAALAKQEKRSFPFFVNRAFYRAAEALMPGEAPIDLNPSRGLFSRAWDVLRGWGRNIMGWMNQKPPQKPMRDEERTPLWETGSSSDSDSDSLSDSTSLSDSESQLSADDWAELERQVEDEEAANRAEAQAEAVEGVEEEGPDNSLLPWQYPQPRADEDDPAAGRDGAEVDGGEPAAEGDDPEMDGDPAAGREAEAVVSPPPPPVIAPNREASPFPPPIYPLPPHLRRPFTGVVPPPPPPLTTVAAVATPAPAPQATSSVVSRAMGPSAQLRPVAPSASSQVFTPQAQATVPAPKKGFLLWDTYLPALKSCLNDLGGGWVQQFIKQKEATFAHPNIGHVVVSGNDANQDVNFELQPQGKVTVQTQAHLLAVSMYQAWEKMGFPRFTIDSVSSPELMEHLITAFKEQAKQHGKSNKLVRALDKVSDVSGTVGWKPSMPEKILAGKRKGF